MGNRLELDELLVTILGTENVYGQAPESTKMEYPAIKYKLSNFNVRFANNSPYNTRSRYTVTLIDYDIDSPYVDKIRSLPYCSMDNYYTADGLHHWAFTLYY